MRSVSFWAYEKIGVIAFHQSVPFCVRGDWRGGEGGRGGYFGRDSVLFA